MLAGFAQSRPLARYVLERRRGRFSRKALKAVISSICRVSQGLSAGDSRSYAPLGNCCNSQVLPSGSLKWT